MILALLVWATLSAMPADPGFDPDRGPPPGEGRPDHFERPGHWGPPRGKALEPTWFDSAMTGLARRPWSGRVALELPNGRVDTARVCGGPSGFRIDFPNGRSMWLAGDSSAFLDSATRTIRNARPHHGFGPPPGMVHPSPYGLDTLLGRPSMVYVVRGPHGSAHRMWVDTTLPLLLRGEGPGPGARRMLSLDLAKGCPEGAFTLPAGWTHRQGPPDGPEPHEEPSIEAVEKALDLKLPRPGWLPAGFSSAGQSWMRPHGQRMAHLRFSNGASLVSIFIRDSKRPFKDCDDSRPCPFDGPDPVEVRRLGGLSVLVTGSIPPADLKRLADRLK